MENQNFDINDNFNEQDTDFIIDASVSDEFKSRCKLYNFRRPDKFSKEHLKALQDIHRDFVKQTPLIAIESPTLTFSKSAEKEIFAPIELSEIFLTDATFSIKPVNILLR